MKITKKNPYKILIASIAVIFFFYSFFIWLIRWIAYLIAKINGNLIMYLTDLNVKIFSITVSFLIFYKFGGMLVKVMKENKKLRYIFLLLFIVMTILLLSL